MDRQAGKRNDMYASDRPGPMFIIAGQSPEAGKPSTTALN
jgi:hypothetical protein